MTVHCPENRSGLQSIDEFVDELIAQDHHRLLDLDIARWREDLQARLARGQQHPEQGLGLIEETICGQFWSTAGDEALLSLEMFCRNERWDLLFPHAKLTAVSNN